MMKIKDPTFFEGIRDFLGSYLPKIKNSSPHTVSSYRTTLTLFVAYLQNSLNYSIYDMDTTLMTQTTIAGFLDWCKTDRGNGAATLNNRLSAMKTFFSYLLQYKDTSLSVSANAIADIRKQQEEDTGPHEYLSQDQMRILFGLPKRDTLYGLRDLMLMSLLYDSACRIDEILSLKLKNIRYLDGLCCINVTGKGRKTRNLPLGKTVEGLIREYSAVFHKEKNRDDFLFYVRRNNIRRQMSQDNTSRILNKYEKQAKAIDPTFPHLHAHLLRHTRSQHWYDAGINLEEIALLLGHSQLTTSLTYTFLNVSRKRAAIEKALGGDEPLFISEKPIFLDEDIIKKLYGL
jgi:site-specific recombinase XerD